MSSNAQTLPYDVYTSASPYQNIRYGADTTYSSIDGFPYLQNLVAWLTTTDAHGNTWYAVDIPDPTGLNYGYVKQGTLLTEPAPCNGYVTIQNTSPTGLHIRTGPSTSSTYVTIGGLPAFCWDLQNFSVVSGSSTTTTSTGTWYEIYLTTNCSSYTGYVCDGSGLGLGYTYLTYTPGTSPTAGTISGSTTVCVGSTITLSDGTTGGTWSSSTVNASVSSSGVVSGVSSGSATISYTITGDCGTAVATYAISVTAPPTVPAITGPSAVCVGAICTLSDGTSGGVWSSSNTSIATVSSGVVTGASVGSAIISYSVTNACGSAAAGKSITVMTLPSAGTISGGTTVCAGSVITLSSSVAGGIWTSGSSSIATVGSSSGVVSGSTVGATVISYTVTNTCGSSTVTTPITVNTVPPSGIISGSDSICVDSTSHLTESVTGGVWSSGTPTIATVNSSTGVVSGLSLGSAIVTYTVTNSCGSSSATVSVSVYDCLTDVREINNSIGAALTVYPNPTSGIFACEVTGISLSDIYEIHIVNELGVTVYLNRHIEAAKTKIDLSKMSLGNYFLQLISKNKVEVVEFEILK